MKKILPLIAFSLLFSSCNFEENCPKRGYIEAIIQKKPALYNKILDRHIMYYPHQDVKEQTFFKAADNFVNDTITRECPTGTYDVIVYNKGRNILRDNNSGSSILLEAPTKHDNGVDYIINEQDYICSSYHSNVQIKQWETTKVNIHLTPLVKIIELDIDITDNTNEELISSIQGKLSGVLTQKYLTGKNGNAYATQLFSTNFKSSQSKLIKTIYVFGVNSSVSNILTLTGTDKDGNTYNTEVDITNQLSTLSDSSGVKIKLSVSFRKDLHIVSVTILGWDTILEPSHNLHSFYE